MNSFSETFFKMTAIKVHSKFIYLMRKLDQDYKQTILKLLISIRKVLKIINMRSGIAY